MPMKGLSMQSLKQHSSLAPLFFFLGLGAAGAAFYTARLALRSPDVGWARQSNPESWNKLPPTYQYKFYSPGMDYKQLRHHPDRPEFEYNVKEQ